MSRSLDPQLHTHVVCANVARGPDGRWTALDGRQLYEHAKTAGYLYQAHLRVEVRERLGLDWGPVSKGAAELEALPAEVLSVFSRRRQEIVEAAREAGIEDLASERGKYLAVLTRERKQYGIETHSWREEVRARASEHGLDQGAIEQLTTTGHERLAAGELGDVAVDERAVGDLLAGGEGLTEKANTFLARDVLREYAAAAEQGARVADVRAQGERFTQRGDVLDTISGEHTTHDLVAAERRLVAAAIGRANEGTAIVDPGVLERALAAVDRPLSDEQAETVRGVTSSGNGVDVVEALAGTGKTFTAGALRQVYEDAGYHVIGIAPTGRAVRELAEEAAVPAWTLARALIDLQHGDTLPERTVVLLDEAGMASTRGTEQLLAAAEDAGAKVIAIGDSGQLPSVQAGGWMREVGQRVGVHRLTQVMRQRDLGERRALAQLHNGRSDAYLDWATNQDRVVVHTDDAATNAALADWKQAAAEHGQGQAVLIARDNTTRATLNAAAREHVRELGQLGEDVDYGPVTVAVGDRVICRRNDRFADVDNGTRATILNTSTHGVLIKTDAGPVRTLPAAYVAEHVEHAYCLTGHGMQGATVEHATVVATPRALTRGWSYTALSRARATTRLHIDGQDVPAGQAERAELAPHDAQPQPERDDVLWRTAQRMTVRDDEDLAMTQLPNRPAPGRPDDDELHHTDPTPTAETPDAGRRALRALRDELAAVSAQRAQLPMPDLYELDAIEQDITRLQGQREHVAARLAAVPEPQRRLLGRTKDPHAAERAHLTTACTAPIANSPRSPISATTSSRRPMVCPPHATSATRWIAANASYNMRLGSCVTASPNAMSSRHRGGRATRSASAPRTRAAPSCGIAASARSRATASTTTSPTRPPASEPNPKTAAPETPGTRPMTPSSNSSDAWAAASTAAVGVTAAPAWSSEHPCRARFVLGALALTISLSFLYTVAAPGAARAAARDGEAKEPRAPSTRGVPLALGLIYAVGRVRRWPELVSSGRPRSAGGGMCGQGLRVVLHGDAGVLVD
jgi:hypothetical protein